MKKDLIGNEDMTLELGRDYTTDVRVIAKTISKGEIFSGLG